MAKIWATRFAESGDKIAIPVPAEADGSVAVSTGWTPDYELADTDPDYKPVGRDEMNGALFGVTDSIRQLQLQGAAEWSADLAPYPKGAEVIHAGERWYSPNAANGTEPGAPGTEWVIAGTVPAASETVAGIAEVATQAEVNAGTAGNMIVTPVKLLFGFAAVLAATGYIKAPSWLGGVIFQWTTVTATASGSGFVATWNFPIPFPTLGLVAGGNYKSNTFVSGGAPVNVSFASNNALTVVLDYTNSTEPPGTQSVFAWAFGH